MVNENTESTTEDMEIALTDEVMKEAYPLFYGQMVRYHIYPPNPGKDRYRMVAEIYPYDIKVDTDRGTVVSTIFFAHGDHAKSFTDIHRFHKGLKDQGVPEGRGSAAIGHEGYWQTTPGRGGFRGATFPTNAPKDSTTPPPPTDWDLDVWLEKYGSENVEQAADTSGILPEELHDALISMAEGNRQGSAKITRQVLEDSRFAQFDPPTMLRTLTHLVDAGRLSLDDGKYVRV